MSVEIEPAELAFHRPLTMEVSEILKIKNPGPTPIAFKVKTTAPKQYCVRPNSGRIEAGREVEVSVLLQAMKEDPPADMKCRDKFLVQSVALTADKEFTSVAAIWEHVDSADKSTVQEKKIRVAFLQPKNNGVAGANNFSTPVRSTTRSVDSLASAPPPSYGTSTSPDVAYTPQTQMATGPISTFDDRPVNSKGLDEIRAEAKAPASSSASTLPAPVAAVAEAVSNAAATVANALPSTEEVQAQLSQAQATASSVVQEGSLRMRKAVGADDSSTTMASGTTTRDVTHGQQTSAGVPVQIVAALCLLSFLLAYFLF